MQLFQRKQFSRNTSVALFEFLLFIEFYFLLDASVMFSQPWKNGKYWFLPFNSGEYLIEKIPLIWDLNMD